MNITKENAVQLPNEDISIIATIYERYISTDLKTGKVNEDLEHVYLAQGYQDVDNPEEFIFHYHVNDEGYDYIQEDNISLVGYREDAWRDENVFEHNLLVITDYVINTGMQIKKTNICKVSDTQNIVSFNSVEMEFRTPKGKILWDLSEEE